MRAVLALNLAGLMALRVGPAIADDADGVVNVGRKFDGEDGALVLASGHRHRRVRRDEQGRAVAPVGRFGRLQQRRRRRLQRRVLARRRRRQLLPRRHQRHLAAVGPGTLRRQQHLSARLLLHHRHRHILRLQKKARILSKNSSRCWAGQPEDG